MSEFLTNLDVVLTDEDTWRLTHPLVYRSDIAGHICIPRGFKTDLATVPRIPIIYVSWGDRAHREAVVHDYLYRQNCAPCVSRDVADRIFLEAMECRGVPWYIRYPMYLGVRSAGWPFWKRNSVAW